MAVPTQSRLQRAVYRVWLAVGVIALVYFAFRMVARPLAVVIGPVLLAGLVVYLLNPLVTVLERRGWPRLLGTTVAYLIFIGGVALVLTLVTPRLVSQFAEFVELMPQIGERLVSTGNQMLSALGLQARFELPTGEAAAAQMEELMANVDQTTALAVLGGISGLASGLLHFVLILVVGPIIAFYLLVDLPRFLDLLRRIIPPDNRAEVADVAGRLNAVVGGYVRGQLLVALFVGCASALALAVIGLPYWLVLGVVAGITNLVPLIGPFVAGALGVLVALATDGVGTALLVVVAMTGVQQLDNHVVSPLVVGRTVKVPPLLVLLALLVAGTAYGLFGLLIAVPLVAGVKVLVTHTWQTRVPWATATAAEGPGDQAPPAGEARDTSGSVAPAPVSRRPLTAGGRAGPTDDHG